MCHNIYLYIYYVRVKRLFSNIKHVLLFELIYFLNFNFFTSNFDIIFCYKTNVPLLSIDWEALPSRMMLTKVAEN